MGVQKSLTFTEHFGHLIEEKARNGRFGSEVDVVQAALRLLEEREKKFDRLCKAIEVGENSGEAVPFDFDDLFAELEAEASR